MSTNEEKRIVLTAAIVAAYVANNLVQAINLPALIVSVHAAVAGLGVPPIPLAPTPAVDPKRSVGPNYIVCLEDGKRFKTLRLHIMTHHNLTPQQYRTKWGLSADYPMLAPNYAAKRSQLGYRSWQSR
jgi:predicted transcriptional regulator